MALVSVASAPAQLGRSVSIGSETEVSPEPATREPLTAIVTQPEGTPLRTAIGRFTPIVKGSGPMGAGAELTVITEATDKKNQPWLSVATADGASGWIPKDAVHVVGEHPLSNDLDAQFEFRSLTHEGELEVWLDLVCEVFGDLNIPRSYFARHWTSDPPALRRLNMILVAVERGCGRMVATVRIFRRTIRVAGGKHTTVGGLGEVSTLPQFRGRGICTRLLRMSLSEMERSGIKASSLHAASAASAIYKRLGWHPVPMPTLTLPLKFNVPGGGCTAPVAHYRVRELSWELEDWAGVTARLAPLNAMFMSPLEGSFVRSDEYWATWIRSPAEALDPDGLPTPGVLRGWEVVAEEEEGETVIAYGIFKRAGSFSSGAEVELAASNGEPMTDADGVLLQAEAEVPTITLMDFASQAEAGSSASEGWLMHLAATAAMAYFALPPRVPGAAAMTCPSLLAPRASRPGGGGVTSPQGEWMCKHSAAIPTRLISWEISDRSRALPDCDVQAANAGMPAIVRRPVFPSRTNRTLWLTLAPVVCRSCCRGWTRRGI